MSILGGVALSDQYAQRTAGALCLPGISVGKAAASMCCLGKLRHGRVRMAEHPCRSHCIESWDQ